MGADPHDLDSARGELVDPVTERRRFQRAPRRTRNLAPTCRICAAGRVRRRITVDQRRVSVPDWILEHACIHRQLERRHACADQVSHASRLDRARSAGRGHGPITEYKARPPILESDQDGNQSAPGRRHVVLVAWRASLIEPPLEHALGDERRQPF